MVKAYISVMVVAVVIIILPQHLQFSLSALHLSNEMEICTLFKTIKSGTVLMIFSIFGFGRQTLDSRRLAVRVHRSERCSLSLSLPCSRFGTCRRRCCALLWQLVQHAWWPNNLFYFLFLKELLCAATFK